MSFQSHRPYFGFQKLGSKLPFTRVGADSLGTHGQQRSAPETVRMTMLYVHASYHPPESKAAAYEFAR